MGLPNQNSASGQVPVTLWDPRAVLKRLEAEEAIYSRGFLRCRPEKWFPGFAAHWLPLAHSLGVEMSLVEVRPLLAPLSGMKMGFAYRVDDEPGAFLIDFESRGAIIDAVCPGAEPGAAAIVLEYFARRLLTSLAMSWSGPESSIVQYETELDPVRVKGAGAIKLAFEINKQIAVIWIVVGRLLLERLDSLWRRQMRSTARQSDESGDVLVEIAQLAVPPTMLVDYLRSGTVVDLEVPYSDQVSLRLFGKPWLPGRLCQIGDHFGVEVISGPVASASLPEGTTRISIQLCKLKADPQYLAEYSQVGAVIDTGHPLSPEVQIVINNEKVGEAKLCTFESRFAISIA